MTFVTRLFVFIALIVGIYSPAVKSQTLFEHETEERQNRSSDRKQSSRRDKLISSVTVKNNPTLRYEDYGSHQVVFLSGESWGNESEQMAANKQIESLLKNKPTVLWVQSSTGGYVNAFVDLIKKTKSKCKNYGAPFFTYVQDKCGSACGIMLLESPKNIARSGAMIGYHIPRQPFKKDAKVAISNVSSDDAVRLISNHDTYSRGIREYLEKNKDKFFQESNENGEVRVNDMEWVRASSTPLIDKSVGFLDRSNINEALFRD